MLVSLKFADAVDIWHQGPYMEAISAMLRYMKTHAMMATVKPQKSPPVPPSVTTNSRFLARSVSVVAKIWGPWGWRTQREAPMYR